MSDLSRQAAKEFLTKVRKQVGAPRVGGSTPAERERALTEKYAGMVDKLERFEPSVLKRAADMMIENRKSFPALSDCLQVCTQIEATDKAALNQPQTKRPPKKRDWSDPAVAKEADNLLLCDIDLARLAADQGWLVDLWLFCAEWNRIPAGCNAYGIDERHDLKLQREETNARSAELRKHPAGAVCLPCAASRGAVPVRPDLEHWIGRCMYCPPDVQDSVCSRPDDWTWRYAGGLRSPIRNLIAMRVQVEQKHARQEARLRDLIEGKRAA